MKTAVLSQLYRLSIMRACARRCSWQVHISEKKVSSRASARRLPRWSPIREALSQDNARARELNLRNTSQALLVAFLLFASAQLAAQTPNNSDKPVPLPRGAVQTEVPKWIPLCVQRRLARSVGDSPTGVRVGTP